MSEPNALDDAEKIRLKRLARLGGGSPGSPPTSNPSSSPTGSSPTPKRLTSQRISPAVTPGQSPQASTKPQMATRRAQDSPVPLDRDLWVHSTIEDVFLVTLDRQHAAASDWKYVWLKPLSLELQAERGSAPRLRFDDLDQVLMARLDIDPESALNDPEYAAVIASLPPDETLFEFLIGCWNRNNTKRSAFSRQSHTTEDSQFGMALFEKIKDLAVSYIGLLVQDPTMFPQRTGKQLGAPELLPSLLSVAALASPLSSSGAEATVIQPQDIDSFINDLLQRFPSQDEQLDEVLGPVVRLLMFNPSLSRPEGIAGGDSSWRAIVAALSVLIRHPSVAKMIARLEEWCPEEAAAHEIERTSLLGPLARLGVFLREWPQIGKTYFSDPRKRSRNDIDSSNNSLRATLNALQTSLFDIVNLLVRAKDAETREQVLHYFGRVISINTRRAGSHVDYRTVATDGFLINLQAVLLRLAEPFMDARYSKLDRIDPDFLARSSRLSISDETRISATSEEVKEYEAEVKGGGEGGPPNFISEIFYLAAAINHYGLVRTIQFEQRLHRSVDDRQNVLDRYEADTHWQGTPFQNQVEAEIARLKADIEKLYMEMFSYQVQLLDPAFLSKAVGFAGFVSAWLIRMVDPRKQHPAVVIELPLPKDQPQAFRMLPEFFLDDIAELYLYLLRNRPESLDLAAQVELINVTVTFLSSPWYIKNPFLKAKLVTVLFYGTLGYGREKTGILHGQLNSHPLCLKHLMAALTSFYIEIESTGSHTQFYDKFNARRDIAYILNAIWHTPGHREALKIVSSETNKFTRFINLMINDVTFLLDESFTKLAEVASIQKEMEQPDWNAKPARQRQERAEQLHSISSQATSWLALAKSTMELLIKFTKETTKPFMTQEIVNRLAAMLDYNLETLVGPKCSNLKVKDPEKFRFNPRQLLSDMLQIYLNLCDEPEFVVAVAQDERSFDPFVFQRATKVATDRSLKSAEDVGRIKSFVHKVEETRKTLEVEEDTADAPEEFIDPIVYTLMKDPVTLPTSGTIVDLSTIKSHLLSDSKDPFNRLPLSIEDVIPNPELKSRIHQFLEDRRNKNAARHDQMDVDQ